MAFKVVRHALAVSGVVGVLSLADPAAPAANRAADVVLATLLPTVHPPVARDASQLWMAPSAGDRTAAAGDPAVVHLQAALRLYAEGAAHAESRGIIIADTKFEFGLLPVAEDDHRPVEDRIILIDEALTPDSSRFWPADGYRPGAAQPSFDKQFVRDYLERIRWNKQPPVPSLPDEVVIRTRETLRLRRISCSCPPIDVMDSLLVS